MKQIVNHALLFLVPSHLVIQPLQVVSHHLVAPQVAFLPQRTHQAVQLLRVVHRAAGQVVPLAVHLLRVVQALPVMLLVVLNHQVVVHHHLAALVLVSNLQVVAVVLTPLSQSLLSA